MRFRQIRRDCIAADMAVIAECIQGGKPVFAKRTSIWTDGRRKRVLAINCGNGFHTTRQNGPSFSTSTLQNSITAPMRGSRSSKLQNTDP
jgi:hypothetical protein